MSIVTLPNGSQYDTSREFSNQLDSGSILFIEEMVDSITPVEVKETTINTDLKRILTQTWTDTSHAGSNYIFETQYIYQYPAMNTSAFALKGSQSIFKIESK